MAVTQLELQQLYVAYFGRPADAIGMEYYTHLPGATIWDVAAGFGSSPESLSLYGPNLTSALINSIYQNLFNRNAESDGIQYWMGKVLKGELTIAGVALAIVLGAQNEDKACIENKLKIAAEFTAGLTMPEFEAWYVGDAAAKSARSFLHGVTQDASSATAAHAGLGAAIQTWIGANSGGSNPPEGTGGSNDQSNPDTGSGGGGTNTGDNNVPGGSGTGSSEGGTAGGDSSSGGTGGTQSGQDGSSNNDPPVPPKQPGDGNNTVIVADADVMSHNARSEPGTSAATNDQDIGFATFVDFDQLNAAN
jgi:trimeric autotransporter adhesin